MRKEKLWYTWNDFPVMSRVSFILSVLALIGVLLH